MSPPRILVVGAGPTGLTAAVELARRGVVPDVIEKRGHASPFSRAVGIQARSMALLHPSGVARALRDEAVRFEGLAMHDGPRPILRLPLADAPGSRLWGLAQDRTEHHLRAALRRHGGDVTYGCALKGLQAEADAILVETDAGFARYDHVIGADGVGSTVRRALGLAYAGYDLPGEWSIADVESPDWPGRAWFNGFLLPGGDVAVVVPLAATRFRVIASRPRALAALPVPMNVSHTHRSGSFTISVRQVARYRVGRVFLAGDAAHCHSPVGGRGMNLGIADAADLAARLVGGDWRGYTAARHGEGRAVIRGSETLRKLLQSEGFLARALVRTGARAISALPPLQRLAARRATGAATGNAEDGHLPP